MFGLSFSNLAIPAFFAGLITFLAPCTLPLVPGYLGFISGISLEDIKRGQINTWRVFIHGLFFVLGFSFVFVGLGLAAGLISSGLVRYQYMLARIGGLFVIVFGLYMLGVVKIPWFNREFKFSTPKFLQQGKKRNSFILGATFGFGWTPCVGPILGSILLLASTQTTIIQGGMLLLIFSFGLALPFLGLALAFGKASYLIKKWSSYLNVISVVGGVFLIFLGVLMIFGNLNIWTSLFYQLFNNDFYSRIYDFL